MGNLDNYGVSASFLELFLCVRCCTKHSEYHKKLRMKVLLLAVCYREGHLYYRHRNWQSQDSNPGLSVAEFFFF